MRGGRWVFGEVILEREILGLRLVLVGCGHNHVVERTRFHRYAFGQNHYAHDISRVVARGAVVGGVTGVFTSLWLLTTRPAGVQFQLITDHNQTNRSLPQKVPCRSSQALRPGCISRLDQPGSSTVLTHTSIRPIHQWVDLLINGPLKMVGPAHPSI